MHGVRKAEGGGLQGVHGREAAQRPAGGDLEAQGSMEGDPVHVHVLRPKVCVLLRGSCGQHDDDSDMIMMTMTTTDDCRHKD